MKALLGAALLLLPGSAMGQMKATSDPSPPVLQAEKDPNALDAVYCRPPQPLPGMHLMGPKICKPNSFWTELHGQGLDLSADGRNTVPSEKYRSLHGEGSIAMPGPAN